MRRHLPATAASPMPGRFDIDLHPPAHPLPHFWEQAFGSGRAILTLREGYRNDLWEVEVAQWHFEVWNEPHIECRAGSTATYSRRPARAGSPSMAASVSWGWEV